MTPRLSREVVKKKTTSDALLNDWHLHHLHMGPRDADGSVRGADEVLVVWAEEDRALLVGVIKHGEWSHAELRAARGPMARGR